MKKGLTELVFILDRSGSMGGLEADTIGGFNSMIETQKAEDGEVFVSTVLFDNKSKVIHDRVDIKQISPMTKREYRVGGCTALLDALGAAIKHIGNIHKYARKEDIPEHTIFIITTDGMENASSSYSYKDVKAAVNRQKEKYGWEFIFFGANIDAIEIGGRMGIDSRHSVRYRQCPTGLKKSYRSMSNYVSNLRENGLSDDSLFDEVREDERENNKDGTKPKTKK